MIYWQAEPPRSNGDGLTLRDLANHFLTAKQNLVDTRELSQRTFDDYHATCQRLIKEFGKTRLVSDLDFPRPKTAVERRAKLWTETIVSLRSSIADRPPAKHEEDDDLVFITKYGKPWAKSGKSNPISVEFRKLLASLTLYRQGLNFYALRHTFETIASGSRDQVAVNHVMGHADASMAAVYREKIEDDRLVAVADHVHDSLFGDKKAQKRATGRGAAAKKRRVSPAKPR
jgi:integrase